MIVDIHPGLSCTLNYPVAPDGGVDVYLLVDHRVIDDGPAASVIRALAQRRVRRIQYPVRAALRQG